MRGQCWPRRGVGAMTDTVAAPAGVDLGRYWSMLASRWRLIVAGAVVGVLVAIAYLLVIPASYTASTTLSVLPISSDPYASNRNNSNLLDMSAEATTASSFKVAELAVQSTGEKWDVAELRAATTATPGADTSTMTITVTAGSEAKARAGAGAMADAYIATRSDQANSNIVESLQRDNDQVEKLRVELADAIRRLEVERAGSPAAAEASADQQLVNQQISALLTRIRTLEGVDTTGGVILNPASVTEITVSPGTTTTLATGLAAGLLLGVVAAFVRSSRRRPVRTARELQRELGIDTLGTVDGRTSEADIAALAQRILRVATRYDARVITVMLDGAVPGESTIVDQLAKAMQAAGSPAHVTPTVRTRAASAKGLDLVPVTGDATPVDRLQALRLSDLVVVIAVAGTTRLRGLTDAIGEAEDMGARIAGVALVSERQPKMDERAAPDESQLD